MVLNVPQASQHMFFLVQCCRRGTLTERSGPDVTDSVRDVIAVLRATSTPRPLPNDELMRLTNE